MIAFHLRFESVTPLVAFTTFIEKRERSSSSAVYSPTVLAISLDLASCSAQIVTPPGLRTSHTTFTETLSPLQSLFPTVVGSTADMASPLPLQHANTVCYVGDFSTLPDNLVSDTIPQRNPEHSSFHTSLSDLELVKGRANHYTLPYLMS
jgi:hypothetical protein